MAKTHVPSSLCIAAHSHSKEVAWSMYRPEKAVAAHRQTLLCWQLQGWSMATALRDPPCVLNNSATRAVNEAPRSVFARPATLRHLQPRKSSCINHAVHACIRRHALGGQRSCTARVLVATASSRTNQN